MFRTLFRCTPFIALCLFFLVPLLGQSTAHPQFVTPSQLKINRTGTQPPLTVGGIVGVADFNTDGRKDILGYSFDTSGNVQQYTVLFHEADGSYTPKLTGIPVGYDPLLGVISDTVQIADVNHDGRPDLIVVTSSPSSQNRDYIYPSGDSTLSAYLGNGDGTFRSVGPAVVAHHLYAKLNALVDLNKDGSPDLIIESITVGADGSSAPPFYTVWNGSSDGKFKAAEKIGQGSFVAAGDLNGDGYPDVVFSLANSNSTGIQVYLNHNGTSFTPGASYPGVNANVAALGDLNHDHKLDLVALEQLDQDKPANPGRILLGNGDGTFRYGGTFQSPIDVSRITIADINGDGEQDVALLTDLTVLQVFPGNGNGTVNNSPVYYPGAYGNFNAYYPVFRITGATLVDLNNTGRLDLLDPDVSGYSLAANDGKGNFRAPKISLSTSRGVNGSSYGTLVAADLNKDGKTDIAIMSQPFNGNPAAVVVYPGTGKGYFGAPKSYQTGVCVGLIAAGDVNRDGKLDLVVARAPHYSCNNTQGDLSVLLGNGDGTFEPARNYSILGPHGGGPNTESKFIALSDVNRDGKLDLIGDWGVALGEGNGQFGHPIPLSAISADIYEMAGGDFNRDGVLDLVITTVDSVGGHAYVLLGNGKGGYTIKGEEQHSDTAFAGSLAIADMNGDGKPDLILRSALVDETDILSILLGKGDGTFEKPIEYTLGYGQYQQYPTLVGDFNRDGKPDLLILQGVSLSGKTPGGPLTLWYGIGGGKLSATPQYYPANLSTPETAAVLDINSDGAPDVVSNFLYNGLVRILNTGDRTPVTK